MTDKAPETVDGTSKDEGTDKRRPNEVRIGAVEAAVAAGLVSAEEAADNAAPITPVPLEGEGQFELPDWTDPPTGAVPAILLEEGVEAEATRVRGPSWKQTSADWEADEDTLGFLVDEQQQADDDEGAAIAGRGEDPLSDVAPFEFDFTPATRRRRVRRDGTPIRPEPLVTDPLDEDVPSTPDDETWQAVVSRKRTRRQRARHRVTRVEVVTAEAPHRNTAVALATGAVLAGIVVACYAAGPVVALTLSAVVLSLAAGETYGAIRRAGRHPVALVGVLAVPAVVVGSYLRGAQAVPVVLAVALILAGVARILSESEGSTLDDLATTLFVVAWTGVLGSFVGLLLNPSSYPHRHGLAYVGAALALTVAHDVGSFAVGSKFGRHRLAPRLSPGKTLEGLLGGTALTLVVAGLLLAHVHPFSLATALTLGVIVVVLAPIGDLVESALKRDLGLKDMGKLLPAHGGISDRIDAMLFVLPATYIFVHVVHVG